ncbi:MAG: hypothetical protein K2N36_09475, partial [Ruminiclostridium sp.]|nr:hypothetical protein [Ruminiclostridium sp.]
MKVVKFKYYDEFHCIGPECPETCCQQWDIHFSKKDYLKYKNLKCSPKLKEALNGCLVRNRADDADESSHYAKIKFNEKGYCSLLDEKGLCM